MYCRILELSKRKKIITSLPGVFPESSPVRLLVKAHDFWDFFSLCFKLMKVIQNWHATCTSANNTNTFCSCLRHLEFRGVHLDERKTKASLHMPWHFHGNHVLAGSSIQACDSRKFRKLFGPVKPFFVHLYVKTEKCIHLKLLVWSEPLFTLRLLE